MTHTLHVRRVAAVLASAGATAALTLIPTAGANAAVDGLYAAVGESGAEYTGPTAGGTCDLTSGTHSDEVESKVFHFNHGARNASVNLHATYTSSDNTADKTHVKGHVDSTLTLKKKHNDLRSFDLAVGGSIKITHDVSGSACRASGEVFGVTQVTFNERKTGWFTLTRDTKKPNSLTEFVLVNVKTEQAVTLNVFEGSQSQATSRALIKPGKYEIVQTEAGLQAGSSSFLAKSQPLSAKVAKTVDLHGVFTPKKH